MTNTPIPEGARIIAPSQFYVESSEANLFARELTNFVPPNSFDAHAHLYDAAHIGKAFAWPTEYATGQVDFDCFRRQQQKWMGELAPSVGLFFAFPARDLDVNSANDFVRDAIKNRPDSRGLLLIKPDDDPAQVEARVLQEGWAGFKVYHVFAHQSDTQNAQICDFLPEWAWEIAHRHELAIMLHQVRARSLADEGNQKTINAMCRKYSGARLILAHAARGFCARHTVEGVSSISGLENVYFDTSAICEPEAFEAILRTFGPTRLLYGSDFPVSEAHGRAISLGDGFHWIYDWQQENWPQGRPILIGLESLLALKHACRTMNCSDGDLERVFCDNARELLGLESQRTPIREQEMYRRAKELIPGGVQLLSKRPEMYAPEVWPPYFREARGIEIITLDGKRVLDFTTNGIGSCLLGYAHPEVTEAVLRRVRLGAMSTLNPPEEVELAQQLMELHPWAQNVRFGRMGGEAMTMAVRLARAATKRNKIAFCGYHGWHDWYLAANLQNGEALEGHLLPGLQPNGVPSALRGTALPFSYNDLDGLTKIVRENQNELAAIVMEPLRNFLPDSGFLEGVRTLCDESGAQLVFDEVTSGFRFHTGGAHLKFGVAPDIAVFAKTLGNGHPMAAVLGMHEAMRGAQESFVSSTYWTESVGPVAALATLKVLRESNVPSHIEKIGNQMRAGLMQIASQAEVPLKIGGFAPLTYLSFEHPQNAALMTLFTSKMLKHGFLAGSGFYPTLAHCSAHVEEYLASAKMILEELGEAIRKDDITQRLTTPVKHSGFARLN